MVNKNLDVAALIGNGVSIAYNSELTVRALTDAIMAEFEVLSPGSVAGAAAKALSELVRKLNADADPEENFEVLLGPLEDMGEALGELRKASTLYEAVNPSISGQIDDVEKFCRHVRRLGLSKVLELVDARGKAVAQESVISRFTAALVDGSMSRVMIGTLNYDHLLDSAVLQRSSNDASDLASGRAQALVQLVHGGRSNVSARKLRSAYDFIASDGWSWQLPRRIVLLHLHGSLALLRHTGTQNIYRFRMDDLREENFWENFRQGKTDFEPVVILTNQHRKSALVQQEPFRNAYDGMRFGLYDASRWLIAGYSFQDDCVNELLKNAWSVRSDTKKPKILISTFGDSIDVDVVARALGIQGAPALNTLNRNLVVHADGLELLPLSPEWARWQI